MTGAHSAFADVVWGVHVGLLVVVLAPYFLPAGDWLKYNVVLTLGILASWHDGAGECQVSSLERRLRGDYMPRRIDHRSATHMELSSPFFAPLVRGLLAPFGRTIGPYGAHNLAYLYFLISCFVSFARLLAWKGVSPYPTGPTGYAYVILIATMAGMFVFGTVLRRMGIHAGSSTERSPPPHEADEH